MPQSEALPIVAGNLALRRLTPDDLAAFQRYRSDPEVGRFQGWSPMTDDEAARFLTDVATSPLLEPGVWSQVAIADAASNALLGDLGLRVSADSSEAEIGFTVAPQAQGRGVGTAAVRAAIGWVFAATPVARIVGVTDARNRPSLALLRRVGMQQLASHEVVFRGEACTELVLAVSRAEAD